MADDKAELLEAVLTLPGNAAILQSEHSAGEPAPTVGDLAAYLHEAGALLRRVAEAGSASRAIALAMIPGDIDALIPDVAARLAQALKAQGLKTPRPAARA